MSERTLIAAPKAHLVLVRAAGAAALRPGARVAVPAGGCKLGRDFDHGLGLGRDAKVSRLHCEITWLAGRFVLRDRGSSNGTFLNGRLVAGEDIGIRAGD